MVHAPLEAATAVSGRQRQEARVPSATTVRALTTTTGTSATTTIMLPPELIALLREVLVRHLEARAPSAEVAPLAEAEVSAEAASVADIASADADKF